MLCDKKSMEYQINREALHEMEQIVPMTLEERAALRKWVKAGHEVDSNPWDYYEGDGYPMNYLQAYRIKYGYSSGPWDYWTGSPHQCYWCKDRRCLIPLDEL